MQRSILILTIGLCLFTSADAQNHPFPCYTKAVRERLGKDTVSADFVRNFYKSWKNYLDSDNVKRYFIRNDEKKEQKGNLTTSEANGYGMIIEVLMAGYEKDSQIYFNGLYAFAKYHHSARSPLLMRWRVSVDTIKKDEGESDTAIDGDLDMAYALILADQQWGSTPEHPYRRQAEETLHAILEQEFDVIGIQLKRGNAISNKDSWARHTIRLSDFMPAHFRVFDSFMGTHIWQDIIGHYQTVYKQVQQSLSPQYHLFPEYLVVNGNDVNFVPNPGLFSNVLHKEGIDDGGRDNQRGMKDGYNSCRVPWRIATDYFLNGDNWSKERLQQLSSGLRSYTGADACLLTDVYPLTDDPVTHKSHLLDDAKNHSADLSIIAPLYLASLVDERKLNWQDKLLTMLTNDEHWPCPPDIIEQPEPPKYYQNTLRMLCLLLLNGSYWQPGGVYEKQ